MEKFKLPNLITENLFYMVLKQKNDVLVKDSGKGEVLFSPIVGGYFEGERLKGEIMPVGTQYSLTTQSMMQLNRNDLECTLLLKTHDNEEILMTYKGTAFFEPEQEEKMKRADYVDPSDYYYRYNLLFETGSTKYDWLNGKCCFAIIGVKDWETVCFEAYMVN